MSSVSSLPHPVEEVEEEEDLNTSNDISHVVRRILLSDPSSDADRAAFTPHAWRTLFRQMDVFVQFR